MECNFGTRSSVGSSSGHAARIRSVAFFRSASTFVGKTIFVVDILHSDNSWIIDALLSDVRGRAMRCLSALISPLIVLFLQLPTCKFGRR